MRAGPKTVLIRLWNCRGRFDVGEPTHNTLADHASEIAVQRDLRKEPKRKEKEVPHESEPVYADDTMRVTVWGRVTPCLLIVSQEDGDRYVELAGVDLARLCRAAREHGITMPSVSAEDKLTQMQKGDAYRKEWAAREKTERTNERSQRAGCKD